MTLAVMWGDGSMSSHSIGEDRGAWDEAIAFSGGKSALAQEFIRRWDRLSSRVHVDRRRTEDRSVPHSPSSAVLGRAKLIRQPKSSDQE